ncbi:hypothetical protein CQ12_16645 [Bradyrhizobium jicamae]|uniref:Uncharacterized protein n=1 Tax=Bradyrhizobium jicamae TaxID=280332 RepID=A0A0R3LF28_9BRAD|nr:hypothetical protein CQ12_16645 [Bradyrhizobium jicamae]
MRLCKNFVRNQIFSQVTGIGLSRCCAWFAVAVFLGYLHLTDAERPLQRLDELTFALELSRAKLEFPRSELTVAKAPCGVASRSIQSLARIFTSS